MKKPDICNVFTDWLIPDILVVSFRALTISVYACIMPVRLAGRYKALD